MHGRIRSAILALALAGSIAVLPSVLAAQVPPRPRVQNWAISPRAGLAVPINDLGRAQDPGLTVGLGIERIVERRRRRHPLWGVRVDAELDRLPGGEGLPDATLFRYTLGVEYWVTSDPDSPFNMKARGGFGGTTLSTGEQPGTTAREPGGTFPTIVAGATASLSVVFVDTQWSSVLAGSKLRGQFGVAGNFKTLHILSFRAGVRIPM